MDQQVIKKSMTAASDLINGLPGALAEFKKGVDQATAEGALVDPSVAFECANALNEIARSMDTVSALLRSLAARIACTSKEGA